MSDYDLYPEQLDRLARMCRAFNEIDGVDTTDSADLFVGRTPVVTGGGNRVGWLVDEIGGAWSFRLDPETEDE